MKTLPKTFWFGLACGLALVALIAAVPALTDFNTTQFDTSNNKVALKSGAPITNAYLANTFTANYAEFTNNVQIDGSLVIPTGATNGFVLTTDGSGTASWRTAGGPAGTTNIFDTTIITNNFFISGKGNSLVVTQTLTVSGQYVYPLAAGTGITFTTNNIGTGQTNLTISATAGGGLVTDVTTLTYSGTNAAGFDCATNGMSYYLLLTNHVLFGASTFANLPAKTAYKTYALCLQQDSAGTWVPKFTNTIVNWASGVQPVITTNGNAVSYLYFHTGLATNSTLVGTPNLDIR